MIGTALFIIIQVTELYSMNGIASLSNRFAAMRSVTRRHEALSEVGAETILTTDELKRARPANLGGSRDGL
jgi:hypothetical protein